MLLKRASFFRNIIIISGVFVHMATGFAAMHTRHSGPGIQDDSSPFLGASTRSLSIPTCTPPTFHTANLDTGHWELNDPDGLRVNGPENSEPYNATFHVAPSTCPLHTFTRKDTVTCLANKHMLFIGDSVTRSHFFSLIRWLVPASAMLGAIDLNENSTIHADAEFQLRYEANGHGKNGYFRMAEGNITLTYVGHYLTSSGHGPIGIPHGNPVHAQAGNVPPPSYQFAKPWLWKEVQIQALAPILYANLGKVDELMVNVGLHPNMLYKVNHSVADAMADLRPLQLLLHEGKTPIWATTTSRVIDLQKGQSFKRREDWSLGPGYQAALDMGWKILDRNGMTRQLYSAAVAAGWNAVAGWVEEPHRHGNLIHFKKFVDRQVYNVLLNLLCPAVPVA